MASTTSALPDGTKLTKPAYSDSADIAVLNTNMDNIANNINLINSNIIDTVPSRLINLSGVGATITIQNNGRHLFILSGAGVARYVVLLVNASSSGAIQTVEIYKGDNATITTSDNTVVYNVSGTASTTIKIVDFAMQGDTVTATAIEL